MNTYSGPFFKEEGFIQSEITTKNGQIIDVEEGADSWRDAVIIPAPYNSHTHTGDSVVDKNISGSIAEVVGPGGIKERELENADDEDIIRAMKRYLEELIRIGSRDIYEFREGGINGIKLLREASKDLSGDLNLRIFARPEEKRYDEWELNKLISIAEGIGLSSYRDWNPVQLQKIAETTRRMDTLFAMHCSEDEREPIEEVIELDPHHLVHMLEANFEDLVSCAVEDIPIVICPRSNLFFGKMPNIPEMLEAGVTLALGTDNAMLCSPDIFREMEAAYRVGMFKGGVEAEEILKMTTWNPRKALNPSSDMGQGNKERDSYLVLKCDADDPAHDIVVKKGPRDIIDIVKW